jgi:phosphatidate cytidylyltransferase
MQKLQNILSSSSKTICKLTNILTRSITGILFVAFSLAAILISDYTYLIFILFICSAALFEFYNLLKKNNKPLNLHAGIISAFIVVTGGYAFLKTNNNIWFLSCLAPILIVPLITFIFDKKTLIKSSAYTILGLIYIALPSVLSLSLLFEGNVYKPQILIEVFIFIWIFDIMAYVIGSLLGKTRMAPKISPKKTWEGFTGGAIFTIAASYLIWKLFPNTVLFNHLIISLTVVIFATPGDLLESYFKRKANIKDSGNILPGHGGILDRFDSFFVVIPFVWVVLKILG